MLISDILNPKRVLCDVNSSSKKAALEILAGLIADADPGLTQTDVFGSLLAREKLGSTGLGKGIALPQVETRRWNFRCLHPPAIRC